MTGGGGITWTDAVFRKASNWKAYVQARVEPARVSPPEAHHEMNFVRVIPKIPNALHMKCVGGAGGLECP